MAGRTRSYGVTLIDLGEPSRYDPGRPPPLQQLLRKLLAAGTMARARRAALAALLVALAAAVAGTAPVVEPLPEVHRVGRFVESPWRFATEDFVLNATPDGQTMIASGLDGSGEKWRLSIGNVGPIRVAASAGNVAVLAGGMRTVLDEETSMYRESVVAVDVRTGEALWDREEEPVYGAADLVVLRAQTGALTGVDIATGRLVWRVELPSAAQVVVVDDAGGKEMVVLWPDGTVEVITTRTGVVTMVWRVRRAADGLVFAWRDVVVLQETSATGAQVRVYRRGAAEPLWHKDFGRTEFFLHPCGDWLCEPGGRLDPATGAAAPATVVPPDEVTVGRWEPIGEYRGRQLVRLDPSLSGDSQMWLGVVRTANQVRPLMPLGGRANACILIGNWLYCDGSAVVDAVSVRLSDLDGLLAEVGGLA
ncbi:hypothetical protein HDA40_003250 [Hamadaea flava]|uniref:PQQ-binding-like beta-propeller repeat protein n=1 Tax=Hamadaea flava TaxID=1742688 RepID=A0ABV8LY84_9ACTN|nr:PQQ-binding-like beta-propeller repeat protein [Hamadaea flava]MCP2324743.1 hypothetical protein [Hamadaea flava]